MQFLCGLYRVVFVSVKHFSNNNEIEEKKIISAVRTPVYLYLKYPYFLNKFF